MGLQITRRVDANWPPNGTPPGAPTAVTSIARDAGATVSFREPASAGSSAITHYVVTPYVGATAQAPTTVPIASLGSITSSDGNTYRKADVTGLTNGTAYTFTMKARSSVGDSSESAASGANTPLSGLVFGDDFNGPAGGALDPEWWVYTRCGYMAQSEVQYYLPQYCVLDGNGNLRIWAEHLAYTGPTYPSDGNRTVTQPWRSGACQSNTRLFYPSAGKTKMTFEAKFQINPSAGNGYWPGFFWLEGQDYLNAWKTDPDQQGWNDAGRSEVDIAEWNETGSSDSYYNNTWAGSMNSVTVTGSGLATSQHVYTFEWTPGVRSRFLRDGTQTFSTTSQVPGTGAQLFMMLYLQMKAGGPTTSESIYTDYVRVFES